ncbi:MAG: trypsin-like peptidase domain-containing protein [Desulfosarcinaceae bacterium]|jgi:serine protease Do
MMATAAGLAPPSAAQSAAALSSNSFTSVAAVISPAVVHIRTLQHSDGIFEQEQPTDEFDDLREFFKRFFGRDPGSGFGRRGTGSGCILQPDGYVVTNHHVIADADQIEVVLKDGRVYPATVVGRDAFTDLALLKIDPDEDLPAVPLGDSDQLTVGQWVLAIGSPFGLAQSVTVGIVSAKGRVIGSGPYDDFIQTDAAINPGNSGGPLVDLGGSLVGINTAIVSTGHGIGFAIPVNLVKEVLDQLRTKGRVTRGWFGIAIQDLTATLREYYQIPEGHGVLVTDVFSGQPAQRAGIRVKDVIVSVADRPMDSVRTLTYTVAGLPVDQEVPVRIWREGELLDLAVTVARRAEGQVEAPALDPADDAPGDDAPGDHALGLAVTDVGAAMARRFMLGEATGVAVTRVEIGSRAQRAGMMVGDVIQEINHSPVADVRQYRRLVTRLDPDAAVEVLIKRLRTGLMVIRIQP